MEDVAREPEEVNVVLITGRRDRRTELGYGARGRTINTKRIGRAERRKLAVLYPYPDGIERPVVRGDCLDGGSNAQRPCAFVSCRYHLAIDVHPTKGTIKENFPGLELEQLLDTCALDAAARDGMTLEDVSLRMNVVRERARQIEAKALERKRAALAKIVVDNDLSEALDTTGTVPIRRQHSEARRGDGADKTAAARQPRTSLEELRALAAQREALIEADDASIGEVANEPVAEVAKMARQATCLKSEGGCGKVFDVANATGRASKRCPECKPPRAKLVRPSTSIERAEAVAAGVDIEPLTRTLQRTQLAPLFTVRLGRLEIECHTIDALETLVSRWGGVAAP